jgi:hypothetical protein
MSVESKEAQLLQQDAVSCFRSSSKFLTLSQMSAIPSDVIGFFHTGSSESIHSSSLWIPDGAGEKPRKRNNSGLNQIVSMTHSVRGFTRRLGTGQTREKAKFSL